MSLISNGEHHPYPDISFRSFMELVEIQKGSVPQNFEYEKYADAAEVSRLRRKALVNEFLRFLNVYRPQLSHWFYSQDADEVFSLVGRVGQPNQFWGDEGIRALDLILEILIRTPIGPSKSRKLVREIFNQLGVWGAIQSADSRTLEYKIVEILNALNPVNPFTEFYRIFYKDKGGAGVGNLVSIYKQIPWGSDFPAYNSFEAAERLTFLKSLNFRATGGAKLGIQSSELAGDKASEVASLIREIETHYPQSQNGTCGVWARWLLGRLPN